MAYTTINNGKIYFNTKLYSGNGSTQSITGVGFQPDWTWIKGRSGTYGVSNHKVYDVVRGATKTLFVNLTNAETTQTNTLTSFDSDGFSLGNDTNVNASSTEFVSWNWYTGATASSNTNGSITSTVSANTTAGFSIVTYDGTGSAGATVGHGLGVAPSMIIAKKMDGAASNWAVYHKSLGATKYLIINSTATSITSNTRWNNVEPTSSVFTVGSSGDVNNNGETIVAYCFAEKKGFSRMGQYTGNGSTTDGTFVYTGHSVAWVMIKQSNEARDWVIYDNKRDAFNVKDNFIVPNSSNAEGSGNTSLQIDFLSNGFKLRGGNHALNKSGGSYIYMAFAENPFTTSTGIPTTAR